MSVSVIYCILDVIKSSRTVKVQWKSKLITYITMMAMIVVKHPLLKQANMLIHLPPWHLRHKNLEITTLLNAKRTQNWQISERRCPSEATMAPGSRVYLAYEPLLWRRFLDRRARCLGGVIGANSQASMKTLKLMKSKRKKA